jgi:hypothetical protein
METPDTLIHQHAAASSQNNFILWVGILAGPVAWLVHFQTSYALVLWVCAHGHESILHVVSLLCVIGALAGAAVAWREFNARQQSTARRMEEEEPITRSRFMAAVGMMNSALFALVIVAQGIPSFIISPCAR